MSETTYLVFGDLHGRVLPAFRLATVWAREHKVSVAGILQVGDLGYFPDPTRLDKATKRHAERDPLELGVQLVTQPSKIADEVLGADNVPAGLWFTAGNHEDFDALEEHQHGSAASKSSFPVDAYHKLVCIGDGCVAALPGGLRVGALWGIDDQAPRARKRTPPRGRIRTRSATALTAAEFDVLLMHESPRDAIFPDSGSEDISALIHLARPKFAFFGHYGSADRRIEGDFRDTQVFHLHGLEFRGKGGGAENGSVGVLTWSAKGGTFAYLDADWLKTITRQNWRYR